MSISRPRRLRKTSKPRRVEPLELLCGPHLAFYSLLRLKPLLQRLCLPQPTFRGLKLLAILAVFMRF